MKRRQFVKYTSIAPIMVGMRSMLGMGPILSRNFKTWNINEWNNIVDLARWCPTVHNLQPHRVEVKSVSNATLYYDASRLLPVGDPEEKFTRVALGIFIENLSIAASTYGKEIRISKLYDYTKKHTSGNIPFAELELVDRNGTEVINPQMILKRRTSRGKYQAQAIAHKTFKKIRTEANKLGHHFGCSNNLSLIESLKDINQKALFRDLNHKDMRNELDGLFRYSEEEAEKKRDGLSAKCMGFKGSLLKSVFRNHEKWTNGFRAKILRRTYSSTLNGTQSICWFQGNFSTTEEFVQAGRLQARAWLRITEDGAYIHPFGSLITNTEAYKSISKKINPKEHEGKMWMVFRIGYSSEPARSQRLNLSEILINK